MSKKLPEVTLGFWIIKIMSTTVGETCADYLAESIGWVPAITATIMLGLLLAALVLQLRTPTYVPWTYWLTVILISVVGTGLTDALTDKLGVRLYTSTAFFALALLTTFWTWYLSDDSLSFETICTRRSESFYWTAILWTFALGTAAGDLATAVLGLGFARAVLVFGVLVGVTGIASRLGLSSVATFWIAYVLTMPLGAALGDLLTQSQHYGGFGWSARATSGIFLAVIIGLVALAPRRTAIPIDS